MALSDTVLAFKILEGAMINENQYQIPSILASDLTLRSMEAILKQIFGDKAYSKLSNDGQKTSYPTIKEEIAFYIEQKKSKCRNKKSNHVAKQG